jgi:hypothetical protein
MERKTTWWGILSSWPGNRPGAIPPGIRAMKQEEMTGPMLAIGFFRVSGSNHLIE